MKILILKKPKAAAIQKTNVLHVSLSKALQVKDEVSAVHGPKRHIEYIMRLVTWFFSIKG